MSEDKNKWVTEDIEEFSDFDLVENYKENKELVVKNEEGSPVSEIPEESISKIFDEDFETARKNILAVASQGEGVLKSMIALAEASDHPRAFEVVATIMKTITGTNKELIALHKQKTDISKKSKEAGTIETPSTQNNTQQNIFVGSTAELQKFLESGNDR